MNSGEYFYTLATLNGESPEERAAGERLQKLAQDLEELQQKELRLVGEMRAEICKTERKTLRKVMATALLENIRVHNSSLSEAMEGRRKMGTPDCSRIWSVLRTCPGCPWKDLQLL